MQDLLYQLVFLLNVIVTACHIESIITHLHICTHTRIWETHTHTHTPTQTHKPPHPPHKHTHTTTHTDTNAHTHTHQHPRTHTHTHTHLTPHTNTGQTEPLPADSALHRSCVVRA